MLREDAVLNERGRMAADIHDTVVQGLNAIVLQLEAAEEEFLDNPDQALRRLRRVREVARESLMEARRSMWTLCHGSFDNEDPAVALESLARKMFEGTNITLQFGLQKRASALPPEVGFELLRIGKESLVNVLRHARASKVRIELVYRPQEVRLSVLDDGRGFVPIPFSITQQRFGLFGLQTRAEHLGGRVAVQSHPGRGTRILARVPIPPEVLQRSA
jgi:signal transduction histidine kinase